MPETTNPTVIVETSQGSIELELYADKAPKTVENFLAYVDDKFYDGTIFHRVIENFMIQGGGLTEDYGKKATRSAIENEADNGLTNDLGTVAMARTNEPHSATAQFFINAVETNDFLNHQGKFADGWGYCVFGKVTAGMDVVEAIRKVDTTTMGSYRDAPKDNVVIRSIRRA